MKVNKFCGLPPSGLPHMKVFLFLSIFFNVVGCTTSKTVSTNTQNTNFSDDLSKVRVKFEETQIQNSQVEVLTNIQQNIPQNKIKNEPIGSINTELDTLNARIANSNRSFTIKGFRIQVYSGLQRKDAEMVKMDLKKILPNETADLEYSQPNYKVKIGNFLNRIDAYQTYYKIREVYPSASIVFEKIKVPRH